MSRYVFRPLLRAAAFATVFAAFAGPAAAASLSSLVGGGSLSTADVTVNGFSYNDVGGGFGDVAVPASTVDVSISSTANTVRLLFTFDPLIDLTAPDDVFEINGGFTVNVGSSRLLTEVAYDFVSFDRDGDAFVEVGSSTFGGLVIFSNGGEQHTDSEAIAPPVGSLAFLWDAQGEVFSAGGAADLGAFGVTFTLDSDFTPTGAVPVPAALPLLASGVLAFGFAGWRRRRG